MNFFEKPVEGESPNKEGVIDKIRSSVQGVVNESSLPTREKLGYDSTVGVYGGKIVTKEEEGKEVMVFNMRGIVSNIDRIGDAVLRTYDEHIIKDPIKMLKKHPSLFFRFIAPGTKRYRGKPEEIAENCKRLGLEDKYSLHKEGIEIKDQDIYKSGRPLQDIYRSNDIEGCDLKDVDRFDALRKSVLYIREVHQKYGAIGEVLPSDIIFKEKKGNDVSEPVLNIPDIVYNNEKRTSENDKKTTDLLDFVTSIAFEELRISEDWDEVRRAIKTIVESYQDKEIIHLLKSFVKRGRLTMQGANKLEDFSKTSNISMPVFSMHNKARINFDKNLTETIREIIISECDKYLKDN